ncbi:unnamed protein product [Prunus armeniaca]|uniref:Integrase catalytic domain-containing protein n=1 Tax=Prunus armeniaca TaxID=36596 RepID=A0A6J5V269_PRUAR|nr:unnamed protein product [Prunus armeniaca]
MDANGFHVKDNKTVKVLLIGSSSSGLYHIHIEPEISEKLGFYGEKTTQEVWHARLGHLSQAVFRVLLNKHKLPLHGSFDSHKACHICPLGKSCKLPFSSRHSHAQQPLDLLHLDLWGPAPVSSNFGYRYYLSIVDDCTRFVWFYPLTKKSDVLGTFVIFKRMVEKRLNCTIKMLQIDGGGEFTSRMFLNFLREHGISYQISCPYTPQQNGVVERKHRHIVEMGICLLSQSHLPHSLWLEAFSTAVFLINKLPSLHLGALSPYENLFQCPPDYTFLKMFGNYKGYKCLDMASGRVYISRHVTFDEHTFPYHITPSQQPTIQVPSPLSTVLEPVFSKDLLQPSLPPAPPLATVPSSPSAITPISDSPAGPMTPPDFPMQPSIHDEHSTAPASPPSQAYPLCDFASPSLTSSTPDTSPLPGKFRSVQELQKLLHGPSAHPLPEGLTASLANSLFVEPTSYTQAAKHPHWQSAMHEEYDALLRNNTWSLVPAVPSMNIVGCKWVFKVKRKADGSIERHKARLVAKGFNQQEGLDYDETFSPVVKPATVRTILALTISHKWPL